MMMRYIARRLVLLVPVLLGISIFIFSLIHFAPAIPSTLPWAWTTIRR